MAKKKKSKDAGGEEAAPAPPQPPPPKEPVDPKWVWPPFPPPPDGTRIIPFSEFVPKGIVISIDDDQAEHDAEGIPTIELLVKHGAASRKKSKKKKDPFADISEEELRKMTWDKRWELGEEMRTGRPLEPYVSKAVFIQRTHLPKGAICQKTGLKNRLNSFVRPVRGTILVKKSGIR